MSNEILNGVRVLDFTTIVSGPYCTRLLADLGADVIKIEPPEGDFVRTQPPIRAGKSAYFAHLNCGKKSLAIDLRQAGAIELVHELAAKSDIVVENSRPGVMGWLRLGPPLLRCRSACPRRRQRGGAFERVGVFRGSHHRAIRETDPSRRRRPRHGRTCKWVRFLLSE